MIDWKDRTLGPLVLYLGGADLFGGRVLWMRWPSSEGQDCWQQDSV